jgi:hypothetical protein
MTPPPNFALRIIVQEDRKRVRGLNANFADAAPDCSLDTNECNAWLDILCKHFTDRLWPRSGGMDAIRQFMANLQHAMVPAGWKVDLFMVAA